MHRCMESDRLFHHLMQNYRANTFTVVYVFYLLEMIKLKWIRVSLSLKMNVFIDIASKSM